MNKIKYRNTPEQGECGSDNNRLRQDYSEGLVSHEVERTPEGQGGYGKVIIIKFSSVILMKLKLSEGSHDGWQKPPDIEILNLIKKPKSANAIKEKSASLQLLTYLGIKIAFTLGGVHN